MAIERLNNANDVDELTFHPNAIKIYYKPKTLVYKKNDENKYMEHSNNEPISFEDLKTILKN